MEVYETETQDIDLRNIRFHGRVLDIGGGGEGVISRHYGNAVVSIDKRREELEETPDIGLKIIMDACALKFLDRSFENITCFYSLMYMSEQEIVLFFKEAYRVLRNDGSLWIWDVSIPFPPKADIFIAQVSVTISDEQRITTGYGAEWEREQSLDIIRRLCEKAGFFVKEERRIDQSFFIRLSKSSSSTRDAKRGFR